jgi:hypothetical protein
VAGTRAVNGDALNHVRVRHPWLHLHPTPLQQRQHGGFGALQAWELVTVVVTETGPCPKCVFRKIRGSHL